MNADLDWAIACVLAALAGWAVGRFGRGEFTDAQKARLMMVLLFGSLAWIFWLIAAIGNETHCCELF